jgi:hypothetical protein
MPNAMEVEPEKWSERLTLFDDGTYSVIVGVLIVGVHKGERRVAERWNGPSSDAPSGFPTEDGQPTWHLVPPFLEMPVLSGVKEEFIRNRTKQTGNNKLEWVEQEIQRRKAAR